MTRRQIFLLAMILVVGGCIRFYQIGRPSLWLDEIWSIEMARGQGSQHSQFVDGVVRTDQPDLTSLATAGPWWRIWSHVELIVHPPLYFIVLRWWIDLFGNSAAAARSLSAIMSVLGIAVFFDVCRLLHGPRIAIVAAALMMLAIGQIEIGQEARSYPQLIFFGLCACDVLVRIELFGASFRRLFLLCAFFVAMMLTHYFAAGGVAAMALYALIRLRGQCRIRAIAAIGIAGIVFAAVWGWEFWDQMRTYPTLSPAYLRDTAPHHVLRTVARVARLPLEYLVGESLGRKLGLAWRVVPVLIVMYAISRLRAKGELLLWVLWVGCVAGWAAAVDLAHHSKVLDYLHYTILASPGVYALVVSVEWPRLGKLRDALAYGVLAVLAVLVGLRLGNGVAANMDFRSFSQYIDSHAGPDDLLIFYHPTRLSSTPGRWYLCYKYYSPQSRHPWVTLRGPPDAGLLAEIGRRKTVWVVGVDAQSDGPQILPGWQVGQCFSNSAGVACEMTHALSAAP